MLDIVLILLAAFGAGVLNTIAGGGYAGAPISRALPTSVIRAIVAVVGFSMSAVFFWRLLS